MKKAAAADRLKGVKESETDVFLLHVVLMRNPMTDSAQLHCRPIHFFRFASYLGD